MTKKFAIVSALLVALLPTLVKADCDAGTFVQQLSSLDRVSSSGTTLTDAAGMVQQDRFNVFNGRQVDLYDTQDDVYDTKEARSELNKDVAALLSSDERRHIEGSENTIVTVNFEKCLDELPKAVSVGVSQLTVLPDGLGAYAINHLNYTDDHGFFRYENISSSLSELGHVFLPEEEAEMTVAFVGDPDYAIVQLPESLYCGSLGCNFLVLDRFGALVADVFGVPGEVYVRQTAAPRKSELLFFDGKGAVVSVPLNANAQAAAVATPTQDDLFVVANTLPPDDYLSLRTDPSTKSGSRITKMPNGTKISVLERRDDGWWLVEMVDTGQRGWAKSGTNSRQWIVNEADVSVTNNDIDQTQSSAINQKETTQDYSDVITETNKDDSLASNSGNADHGDGQGFMVKKYLGVSSVKELNGAVICVQTGTTTELNLADFFQQNNITYDPITVADDDEAQRNYLAGTCDAITTDSAGLAAMRSSFPDPENHILLPAIFDLHDPKTAVEQTHVATISGRVTELKVKGVSLGEFTEQPCEPKFTDIANPIVPTQVGMTLNMCYTEKASDGYVAVVFSADGSKIVAVERAQFLEKSAEPRLIIAKAVEFYGPPTMRLEERWSAVYGNAHTINRTGRNKLKRNASGVGLGIVAEFCDDVECPPRKYFRITYDLLDISAFEAAKVEGRAFRAQKKLDALDEQEF